MLKTYLQENQIIIPSYQLYGGSTGYQDYGIIGTQIKNKLLNIWRNFFLGDEIHEVELPSIMPHAVLKASGHVDRFTDYVVYDAFGMCHRADHFAKKWFDDHNHPNLSNMVDSWTQETLQYNMNKYLMMNAINAKKWFIDHNMIKLSDEVESWSRERLEYEIAQYGIPDPVIVVQKKNLMIEVPSNTLKQDALPDFLRPELAQGIFVNFKAYQNYLQNETADFRPFGIAQIGKSYRKEISPQPLVRMREFTQAEIEYFVDPTKKTHPDINRYSNLIIPLLTDIMQEAGINEYILISVNDAIQQKLISHNLMAYFLAKIYLFAMKIGLKKDLVRFRQHQTNEMSHYASQCWDLECKVGGSWLECIGCADRGCYDLTAHTNPKQPLNAKRKLDAPITSTEIIIKPNTSSLAKIHGKMTNNIKTYFENLDKEEAILIAAMIKSQDKFTTNLFCMVDNKQIEFDSAMFTIEEKKVSIMQEYFIPNVIEPSFGIDRLMCAILDQNIWQRPTDIDRTVLSLPVELTVYDIAVFPLHKKDAMINLANEIRTNLIDQGLKCYCDDSSTAIGKRYVRCDEIGVRYVITIDPGSLKTGVVTIRYRDTMEQVVVHCYDVYATISNGRLR